MSSDPFVVISSDTHAGASVEGYKEYLDAKHQSLFEDWRGTYKNPQKKHIGSKKHLNWDDDARMSDMSDDGVVGEIIFPNTVPPFFKTSVLICGNPRPEDYELRFKGIQAHNRWLKDWCSEYPDQRAGIGLVYLNDIDAAIKEIEWIANSGLRGGILLPHVPDDCTSFIKPLYHPDYDPMWALIEESGLVVNHHGGTGSPDYGRLPISLPIRLIETPFFSTRSYSQLLLSGVFHRFPKLKYIITESGCAWVPETLQRLDACLFSLFVEALRHVPQTHDPRQFDVPPPIEPLASDDFHGPATLNIDGDGHGALRGIRARENRIQGRPRGPVYRFLS